MGLHQTKKFLHSKGKHQQNKKKTCIKGEIFANISDEGLIFKMYKELTKLITKNTNHPYKKWTNGLNRHWLILVDAKRGSNSQPWCIRTMLQPPELPGQGL